MVKKMNRLFLIFVLTGTLGTLQFVGCGVNQAKTAAELHLQAPGMHCDGCVETLETTIRKLPGVDSVKANLETKAVYVRVDTFLTSQPAMRSLIERLGFSEPLEENDSE
jgi:copper chaperone CopZ